MLRTLFLRRTAMIQFRYGPNGKTDQMEKLKVSKNGSVTVVGVVAAAPAVAATVKDLPKWLQPRTIDQDEVDAINGGGAALIIEKKKHK